METEVLTFEEIKQRYPNEWVLLGNPIYTDLEVVSAIVISHYKEKKDLVKNRPIWRNSFETATTIYTGMISSKRYLM